MNEQTTEERLAELTEAIENVEHDLDEQFNKLDLYLTLKHGGNIKPTTPKERSEAENAGAEAEYDCRLNIDTAKATYGYNLEHAFREDEGGRPDDIFLSAIMHEMMVLERIKNDIQAATHIPPVFMEREADPIPDDELPF